MTPEVDIQDLPSPAASFVTQGTSRSRAGRYALPDLEIDTQAPLPLRNGISM